MAAFWPIGTAQIIRIASYPIRKKSRFWLFCMWSVKEMYDALLPKTDYRDTGRGPDRKLDTWPNDLSSNYPLCLSFKTLASKVFFIGNKFFFLNRSPKTRRKSYLIKICWFFIVFTWVQQTSWIGVRPNSLLFL